MVACPYKETFIEAIKGNLTLDEVYFSNIRCMIIGKLLQII